MKALTLNGYDGLASLRLAGGGRRPSRDRTTCWSRCGRRASIRSMPRSRAAMPGRRGRCRTSLAAIAPASSARSAARSPASRSEMKSMASPTRRAGARTPNYVAMPAATVARKPAGLSDVEAASLPISGLSAYAGLVTAGQARTRPARADSRRRGRRRQLCGAARQASWRVGRGHRRHRQPRLRPLARGRSGHRLHQDRFRQGDQRLRSGVRSDRRGRALQFVCRCSSPAA